MRARMFGRARVRCFAAARTGVRRRETAVRRVGTGGAAVRTCGALVAVAVTVAEVGLCSAGVDTTPEEPVLTCPASACDVEREFVGVLCPVVTAVDDTRGAGSGDG
jgi:hypothetical protein